MLLDIFLLLLDQFGQATEVFYQFVVALCIERFVYVGT